MEIAVTIVIVAAAATIIYKNIKSSTKGECNCSDCDKKCSKREEIIEKR